MTQPSQPNSETEPSDRDLLTQFVTHRDEASFRLIVTRHSVLVWSVCRRMLSCPQDQEDVFQATFLKLLLHADRQVWHETLGGWLHKVAYRLSLKLCVMRSREQAMESIEEPAIEQDCLKEIQRQDAERALHEAIAQLPRRDRQAIVLYYFQNKSRKEAAAEMGCSLEALRGVLQRGRRKLYLRLSCRGLSCSLALVALEQTLTAATPGLPGLIEKTVTLGFPHPNGGSSMPSSPRVEQIFQGETMAMLQSGLANKSLALVGFTTLLCTGLMGVFAGDYGGKVAHAAPVLEIQKADENEASPAAVLEQDQVSRPSKPQAEITPDEIRKIIAQLNANTQAERNSAIEDLIEIGEPALPHLVTSIRQSKDRSFRKLAKQTHKDISKEVFIDDLGEKSPPGWKRFCKVAGDSSTSRTLFAEMYEQYGEVIRLSEQDPQQGAEFIVKTCTEAGQNMHPLPKGGWRPVSRELLATLVFLAMDSKIQVAIPVAEEAIAKTLTVVGPMQVVGLHARMNEVQIILDASKQLLNDENSSDDTYKVLRRLVFEWLAKQSEMPFSGPTSVTCRLLEDLGMHEEQMEMITTWLSVGQNDVIKRWVPLDNNEDGIHQAIRIITPNASDVASLIHVLGRLGDETHIPMLELWLENVTLLQEPYQAQLRDVALNTLIHLSGQSCREYGFKNEFDSGKTFMWRAEIEYDDGEKGREAAMAKWRAWAKENVGDKVEAPAK